MVKKTGINGIEQAQAAAQDARQAQLEADLAYFGMMSGIEIPTADEEADNEADNE